jgi:hypothetical protein
MTERLSMPGLAHIVLKSLSGLLTVAILIQFFIAGMSSITNPDWWTYHTRFGSTFFNGWWADGRKEASGGP